MALSHDDLRKAGERRLAMDVAGYYGDGVYVRGQPVTRGPLEAKAIELQRQVKPYGPTWQLVGELLVTICRQLEAARAVNPATMPAGYVCPHCLMAHPGQAHCPLPCDYNSGTTDTIELPAPCGGKPGGEWLAGQGRAPHAVVKEVMHGDFEVRMELPRGDSEAARERLLRNLDPNRPR